MLFAVVFSYIALLQLKLRASMMTAQFQVVCVTNPTEIIKAIKEHLILFLPDIILRTYETFPAIGRVTIIFALAATMYDTETRER